MDVTEWKFTKLVNFERWQQVQLESAVVSRMGRTIDYNHVEQTLHSAVDE